MNFHTAMIPFYPSQPELLSIQLAEEAATHSLAHLISATPMQFFQGGDWFVLAVWGPR